MELFIKTKFFDRYKVPLSEVQDSIDDKIYQYATDLLNNIRYGFETPINYKNFEDISLYKEILQSKIYCDYCLCDFDLNVIISRIKQLTSQLC